MKIESMFNGKIEFNISGKIGLNKSLDALQKNTNMSNEKIIELRGKAIEIKNLKI